jgi:carboxylesterase type B
MMQEHTGTSSYHDQGLSNFNRPKSPQTHFPLRLEDGLIGLPPGVASHSEDIFDELNCLNLNITIPAGANERSNLPVLIYIHGGGGFSGSNGDWWCDGGSIVKRSMEIGKPVIAVTIKYVSHLHRCSIT